MKMVTDIEIQVTLSRIDTYITLELKENDPIQLLTD